MKKFMSKEAKCSFTYILVFQNDIWWLLYTLCSWKWNYARAVAKGSWQCCLHMYIITANEQSESKPKLQFSISHCSLCFRGIISPEFIYYSNICQYITETSEYHFKVKTRKVPEISYYGNPRPSGSQVTHCYWKSSN